MKMLSEEHKKKISNSMKGRILSEGTKAKISKTMSIKMKGNQVWLGRHHTDETKKKLKLIKQNSSDEFRKKINELNKGKHLSPNTEFKKGHKALSGKECNLWKGGISFYPYSFDFNEELKMLIRKRDDFKCQICLAPAINVHHIDYDKNNSNPNNLIVLCKGCHAKTNFNREYWGSYFKHEK